MTASFIVLALPAAFILYVLFGYPLLLRWRAATAGKPVKKSFSPRTVNVLLAVRNGENWIGRKLDSLFALDYPRDLMEIFVLSNGSSDGTVAKALAREREAATLGIRLRVFDLPAMGKSDALNTGLKEAAGEIVFFTDVRQMLSRGALHELVACFGDPQVGVASGELVMNNPATGEEVQTSAYWRYEKQLRLWQSRVDSIIGATGAIYAQRRELCRPLPPYTLLDDVHQPLNAFFAGYRVILDPAAKAYDDPANLDLEFRRKVRTLAGNFQIFRHYPELFGPRNRMLWHFLSHKFARLLLPWAMLAAWIGSWWLPWPYGLLAGASQAAFYALAALDPFLPDGAALRRLTSPVRAFVVLMAAAAWSASILFRPAKSFW